MRSRVDSSAVTRFDASVVSALSGRYLMQDARSWSLNQMASSSVEAFVEALKTAV